MNSPLPRLLWDQWEFHRQVLKALDDALEDLRGTDGFDEGWRSGRTVAGTRTPVRQSPMLGNGAPHRDLGGFHRFARRYAEAEGVSWTEDRCSYERYQDFAFSTSGSWWDGCKELLMVAECESNSAELLGELAGLLSVRSRVKYLFIDADETLLRLNRFCHDNPSAVDWPGTTHYVIEIPEHPSRPSTWTTYTARATNAEVPLTFAKWTP